MRLHGKFAVITGGGKGIGRAIAGRFVAEGAGVLISGTDEAALSATAERLRAGGGRAVAFTCDVVDEDAVRAMVEAALAEFGRVDILVNNSGIAGPTAPAVEVTRADWDRVLAVNLTGAFLCARHVLPHMMERRSGAIINITSVAGLMGYPLRSPYCASKWGMIGLTRTLAGEVGPYNITVNAIAPGPIQGPRISEVIRRRAEQTGRSAEEVEREYVDPIALKRMAEEADIAAMAVFLASDEGRNLTGETINVSGGYRI